MSPSTPRVAAMLADARSAGCAVAAINIVDVATMDGVLAAAATRGSPIIVQAAARTARLWGPDVLAAAFRSLSKRYAGESALALDHCQDVDLIDACLAAGWDLVLFDGSGLPVAENIAITRSVVERARRHGASVEGELEAMRGHEHGTGSGDDIPLAPIDASVAFIKATGIDCFAPAIGNIHGRSRTPAVLDIPRAASIAELGGVPLVLHGGTGLDPADMRRLVAVGCAKVNVSTALREASMDAIREALPGAGEEPGLVFDAMRVAAGVVAADTLAIVTSAGRP
ncbi:MAG: class II fructose-bisphosphate aldolase [Chloroflexota bacterium]